MGLAVFPALTAPIARSIVRGVIAMARPRGDDDAPGPVYLTPETLPEAFRGYELNAEDAPEGAVASWTSRLGGVTITQATAGSRPVKSAVSWGDGVPTVDWDGVDDHLTGASGPNHNAGLSITLAKRGAANGAAASPQNRTIWRYGRPSDGKYWMLLTQRQGVDGAQKVVRSSPLGTSTGAVTMPPTATGWPVGARAILANHMTADGRMSGSISGAIFSARTSLANVGANTLAGIQYGGDPGAAADRQQMALAVHAIHPAEAFTEFDYVSPTSKANYWQHQVLIGMWAWWAKATAELDAAHPFKSVAPEVRHLTDLRPVHQSAGNSIMANGVSGRIAEAGGYDAKGVVQVNGGQPGDTTTEIVDNLLAGFAGGAGVPDGASLETILLRAWDIGPFFANGPTVVGGESDADKTALMFGDLARLIDDIEAAWGVGPGEAHINLCAFELTDQMYLVDGVPNAALALRNARQAQLMATWPTYARRDQYAQLVADGGPDGVAPDPTRFALGRIPALYDLDGLHLTTVDGGGSQRLGVLLNEDKVEKGYVV